MSVRPKLTIERTFDASIEEVWELWTTVEGIQLWWGPEGFSVVVNALDLRPGGVLDYAMSATRAEEIEFMVQSGMPITTEHRLTFTEVDPPRLLAYKDLADFIPGVEPYEVQTKIELSEVEEGVRMIITFDRMHDERWTELARLGRESELERLAKVLAARE